MYAALEKMQANRKMGVRLSLRRAVRASVMPVPMSRASRLIPKAASRLCKISILNSIR